MASNLTQDYQELKTEGKTEVLGENCPTGTMYTTHIIDS
jgi:hypothetical protein